MKMFLCLCLLTISSMSFGALSESSVKTLNGRSGSVVLSKADVSLSYAVESLVIQHTFTSEHSINDVETIGSLPANSRVVGGFFRVDSSSVYSSSNAGSWYIGTTANPQAVSGGLALNHYDNDVWSTLVEGIMYYKSSSATDIKLQHLSNTIGMTGKQIDVVLLYVQD